MATWPEYGTARWDVPLKQYIDDVALESADSAGVAVEMAQEAAEAAEAAMDAVLGGVEDGVNAYAAQHEADPDPHPQYAHADAVEQRVVAHEMSTDPHPQYDDGPSLLLLYNNAKV